MTNINLFLLINILKFKGPKPAAATNSNLPPQNHPFNDLFPGNQFPNQNANKVQNKPNTSPFQW